jgi:hypothetical protein
MTIPPPDPSRQRSRLVAIITGALSILVAVLYLAFVTLLDSRGPLRPPPPEAYAGALTAPAVAAAAVPAGAGEAPPPG